MKYRSAIMLASLVACSLGVISNAGASDDKYYPGNGCIPDPGTAGTPVIFLNSIANDSMTDTLSVHCPFVRDSTSIANGTMYAFDRNTTVGQDVSCTITYGGWSVGGATFASSTQPAKTTGTATTLQAVNFGALVQPVFGGTYFAACTIPPKTAAGASHITNFTLFETP